MLSGLTNYVPETALTVFDNLEFFIRIVLAAILGALVGLERSKRQKEAGVRTHCIIACTSALFMILSKYAFVDLVGVAGLRGADPARIAAQVVSGISFLGAGVIFKNGNSIRGLTTAAGMWGTAAVGMAIGAGMYWVGLIEAAVLAGGGRVCPHQKGAGQQLPLLPRPQPSGLEAGGAVPRPRGLLPGASGPAGAVPPPERPGRRQPGGHPLFLAGAAPCGLDAARRPRRRCRMAGALRFL